MDSKPKTLTNDEINEIAARRDIQEMWGAEGINEMVGILRDTAYAVKFDFMSGGPGYVGDLCLLFGDTPDEPLRLIRINGKLQILD
jgi:hypothetical protein